MRVLVTGATGKVGNAVARRLAERGDEVVALVRDVAEARERCRTGSSSPSATSPTRPRPRGRRAESTGVFNCMGMFEQWLADPGIFERVNAEGARNVVAAAREAGARRVVHTSTFDVFHAETRRHGERGRRRRLPEGHRLRALEAARRGAGARRGRATGSRS